MINFQKFYQYRDQLSKGLKELQDNAIISKKSQSVYWVNPFFIFKGNRLKFVEDKCKECVEIVNNIQK